MKKKLALVSISLTIILLAACNGQQRDLVDMESTRVDDKWAVIWDDRTYVIFCVVSRSDRGEQIGYVDGNIDNKISEYDGYSTDEWLVSWMPVDGGAILLKEQSVIEIPDGLEAEY